jgi:hypothetical protein
MDIDASFQELVHPLVLYYNKILNNSFKLLILFNLTSSFPAGFFKGHRPEYLSGKNSAERKELFKTASSGLQGKGFVFCHPGSGQGSRGKG